MGPLIIVPPSLQTLRQRYANAALTLFFWALWLYLWIPFISLIAWLFGIEIFYEEIILMEGYRLLLELFIWYGAVIFLISLLFLSWARYNQFRFRGKDRRKKAILPSLQDLADYFEVDVTLLAKCQKAERLLIRHNKNGRIDKIDFLQPEVSHYADMPSKEVT